MTVHNRGSEPQTVNITVETLPDLLDVCLCRREPIGLRACSCVRLRALQASVHTLLTQFVLRLYKQVTSSTTRFHQILCTQKVTEEKKYRINSVLELWLQQWKETRNDS